ncbi:hypothetical protein, partial [Caballeronia sp. INML3]|uniref:hypothetical protein n=1 Tax=Caballeronia sp. INML3 TaxID=2921752 RepID=UPI00289347AA
YGQCIVANIAIQSYVGRHRRRLGNARQCVSVAQSSQHASSDCVRVPRFQQLQPVKQGRRIDISVFAPVLDLPINRRLEADALRA